mmetsp:Transcript_28233/g.81073  ORF Transcript_28233/g.81073 Transcript_28233/m.81073 type:complete len:203 (+) Transcript_28233:999-1607(+)
MGRCRWRPRRCRSLGRHRLLLRRRARAAAGGGEGGGLGRIRRRRRGRWLLRCFCRGLGQRCRTTGLRSLGGSSCCTEACGCSQRAGFRGLGAADGCGARCQGQLDADHFQVGSTGGCCPPRRGGEEELGPGTEAVYSRKVDQAVADVLGAAAGGRLGRGELGEVSGHDLVSQGTDGQDHRHPLSGAGIALSSRGLRAANASQ